MEESDRDENGDIHEAKSYEVDDENGEKDDEQINASDIPGKPIDLYLLCYYRDHIARLYVQSAFYPLIKYGHDKIDRALINAFCERWYQEINTYHLPFSEMTPTIKDVERITGLPSKVEEVYAVYAGKTMTWQFTYDLIKRPLGKTEAQIKKEETLDSFKSKVNDSKKRKEQCARAYLFYVIGSIICDDKS
ncbi:hypothetical protein MKW98_027990, partial [Papaver atlanticum]